jgi:hypothetical protein
MLKVTIELWPFGDDTRRVVIAEAEIWNDGNHPERPIYGNYKGVFHADGRKQQLLQVAGHERSHGAWALLGKFLELRAKLLPNPESTAGEAGDSGR